MRFSMEEVAGVTEEVTAATEEVTAAVKDEAAAAVIAVPELVKLEEKTDDFLSTVKELPRYVGTAVNDIGRLGIVGGDFVRSGGVLGDQWGDAFSGGFMKGVEEDMTTELPRIVGGIGTLPTFAASGLVAGGGFGSSFASELSSVVSPEALTGIFASAFTGEGVLGALKSIGFQLAEALAVAFITPLATGISMGMTALFSGGAAAGGAAAGGAVWRYGCRRRCWSWRLGCVDWSSGCHPGSGLGRPWSCRRHRVHVWLQ